MFLDENGDGQPLGRRGGARRASASPPAAAARPSRPTSAATPSSKGSSRTRRCSLSVDELTLPDPFLMPRGKGVVVTPRPGVAAVIELAVAPTGEVEGVINGPEGTPLAGAQARAGRRLRPSHGPRDERIRRVLPVRPGRLRPLPAAARRPTARPRSASAPDLASAVELGPDKTVERLGTIRLRAATTIAQARGAAGRLRSRSDVRTRLRPDRCRGRVADALARPLAAAIAAGASVRSHSTYISGYVVVAGGRRRARRPVCRPRTHSSAVASAIARRWLDRAERAGAASVCVGMTGCTAPRRHVADDLAG